MNKYLKTISQAYSLVDATIEVVAYHIVTFAHKFCKWKTLYQTDIKRVILHNICKKEINTAYRANALIYIHKLSIDPRRYGIIFAGELDGDRDENRVCTVNLHATECNIQHQRYLWVKNSHGLEFSLWLLVSSKQPYFSSL